MVKVLLVSSLLILLAGSARAQAPGSSLPAEKFKQRLRNKYLHNDTAQAIINLYGRRQAGGASWMLVSALTAVRAAVGNGSSAPVGGGYVTTEDSGTGAAFLVVMPFMGYGLGKMVHYSNGKLEKTLTAYAAGQHLPKSLRRKLKLRFFNQPIIEYTPVTSKSAK